jgi:hypothetical protein
MIMKHLVNFDYFKGVLKWYLLKNLICLSYHRDNFALICSMNLLFINLLSFINFIANFQAVIVIFLVLYNYRKNNSFSLFL